MFIKTYEDLMYYLSHMSPEELKQKIIIQESNGLINNSFFIDKLDNSDTIITIEGDS